MHAPYNLLDYMKTCETDYVKFFRLYKWALEINGENN